MRRLWFILAVLLLAGCGAGQDSVQAQVEETPIRTSRWGEIITIGQAAQMDAPQLAVSAERLIAVWSAVSDDDVFLYERTFTLQGTIEALTLPIPSAYPRNINLFPVNSGGAHLFWMDAVYNFPEGDTLLWTARLNENAEMPRAHIRLSDTRVESYDVNTTEDGGALVLWTGGQRGEPALYLQSIDVVGRPNFPERLTTDARFPSFVQSNQALFAYWLRASDDLVVRGEIVNGELIEIVSIVDSPALDPTDRIVDFYALTDAQTDYVFWQIVRAEGDAEIWMAYSSSSADNWSNPRRLGIGDLSEESYETSFNGGHALRVNEGESWLVWASPLVDQTVVLSAEINDQIAMVYFSNGQIVAVQPVVDLNHSLVGMPAVYADRDRHLTLAWAERTESGIADLNFTSTRAFDLTEARNQ